MWLAVGNATTVSLYQPLLTAALRRKHFIGVVVRGHAVQRQPARQELIDLSLRQAETHKG